MNSLSRQFENPGNGSYWRDEEPIPAVGGNDRNGLLMNGPYAGDNKGVAALRSWRAEEFGNDAVALVVSRLDAFARPMKAFSYGSVPLRP